MDARVDRIHGSAGPMDWFDRTLNRLRRHFRRVDAESPASARGLELLVSELPSAPEDLVSFFRRSDGVDVHLNDDVVGHLYSLEEARSAYPVALDGEIASRLLAIRADGCGNYDCLVVGPGIARGAVVFWDHESSEGPSHLLAGSFASYFEMWADHVIQVYLPDGREDPQYVAPPLTKWPWVGVAEQSHPWPYDEEWMKERDPRAASLLGDPHTRRWLLRQNG